MKRYAALFLSILLLIALTACRSTGQLNTEMEPSAEETSSPQRQDGQTTPLPGKPMPGKQPSDQQDTRDPGQANDPDPAYSELVERFRALVVDPFGQDSDEPGEMGVLESARAAGDDAVYEMGYLVEDLSGDGIPELAVGELSGLINALYTLVDGKPELVFEGWYRNSYIYMGDGHFYYYGDNSAAENGQGVFYLTKDGTGLECESFLFTSLDSDGDLEVYYNETGSWNPAQSEKSDMTAEDFWTLDPAGGTLLLTPFSRTDGWSATDSGSPVSVRYLTEVGDEDYHWVTLYDGPDACCILFTANSRVTNFTLLNLFPEEYYEDGTIDFSAYPAVMDVTQHILSPEHPIVVELAFIGSIPNLWHLLRRHKWNRPPVRFGSEWRGWIGSTAGGRSGLL
ncbi:hypothetical protein SAMN02910435_01270 [Ruminococcaceae bacterium D5]|nr:hypothetical protein SAMN02910435_01270 [Ruminococcaceae bacterium D5]